MESILDQKMSAQSEGFQFGFAVDPKACAVALRALADGLDDHTIILTKAVQYRVATHGDFETSGVVIHFTEATAEGKAAIRKERAALYGNGEQFPVDVRREDDARLEG